MMIGDVYRCRANARTAFWVVVWVHKATTNLLGVDRFGVPTGVNCRTNKPLRREVVGHVDGITHNAFTITWRTPQ